MEKIVRRSRDTYCSAVLAMFVLAVPGGCIQEPVVLGHLEVHNRTADTLIVTAEHAGEDPLRIDPCGFAKRDDFPLNEVSVSADDQPDSMGFQWGVDRGPLIILVTETGPEALPETPAEVPACRGHLP